MFQYPISNRINKAILREVIAVLARNGMRAKYISRPDEMPGYILIVEGGTKRDVLACLMQVTDQYRVCLDCADPVKIVGDGIVHLTDQPIRGGSHETGVVDTPITKIDEGPLGTYELPRPRKRPNVKHDSLYIVTTIGEIVKAYNEGIK